jgi:hypothetical protein
VAVAVRGRRRGNWLAALFLVLAVAAPASAQDLRGFFNSSYSVTSSKSEQGTTSTRTDFVTNDESLDLNWNKAVTPFLGYRLTLRTERTGSTTTTDNVKTNSDTILLQPLGDFTLATPLYSLNAGLRARELFTEGNTAEPAHLSDRNYFLRFFYTPANLPTASFIIDRTTSVDDHHTRDNNDTRYQFSLQHTISDFIGSYNFSRDVNEDHLVERTRTQDSHVGNLGYSSLWFGDHLAVQSNLTVNHTTTTDEFLTLGTQVVSRTLNRGLRADVDPTPQNSADVPVVTAPGLSAGGGNVPLPLFASVGFELTVRSAIGEMEITVAPEPPFVLPTNLGSVVAFRVFATDDATLVNWTEVTGVGQAYDPLQSKFTLTFPSTTARFFKAFVNANAFGALVKATGITTGTTINVTQGQQRVQTNLSGTYIGGVVFTPVRWASASYNITLSGSLQDPEHFTTWTVTHAGNVTLQVHRLLSVGSTVQYTSTTSDQPGFEPTTSTSYTLNLGSNPLPTLTTALTLARTENTLGGSLQNRTDAANLSVAAKVLPRLNADSTITFSHTDDLLTKQVIYAEGFTLNLNAQVLPRVNSLLNYSVLRQDTSPPTVGQPQISVTHTIGGGTTYTLSRVINVSTRFDYTVAPTSTAFAQTYKVDWIPTEKTSLAIGYRKTTQQSDTLGGGSISGGSDSLTGNVRWTVSRYLDLNANASYTRAVTGDSIQTVQSYNVSAGFRF